MGRTTCDADWSRQVILSCKDLRKSYGPAIVLDRCSLEVESGRCVIIRGPSGGGKSTLLRVLALAEAAESGELRHGETVHCANWVEGTQPPSFPFLTMVFQQLFLWPNLNIRDNLEIVLGQLSTNATSLLVRLGIEHLLAKFPHECSLGQRQRIVVARAILSPASFLLLDEPTSALDRENRVALATELKSVLQDGRGVVIVSHDERDFKMLSNEIYEMQYGLLVRI